MATTKYATRSSEIHIHAHAQSPTLPLKRSTPPNLNYSDPMDAVKKQLLRGIEDQSGTDCSVQFNLQWDIEKYLAEQVIRPGGTKVDRVILRSSFTFTGNARHCYANTCEVYMKWQWPQTYKVLLNAICGDPKSKASGTATGSDTCTYDTKSSQCPVLSARGTKEFLVDVAQQVSWLTASIRLPQNDQVSYSDSHFKRNSPGCYTVVPQELRRVQSEENSCWLPLFHATVIACNYPIPERQEKKGLELPFDLMMTMVPSTLPRAHRGGIYFWGGSQLLFPAAAFNDGSIQWHLKTDPSGIALDDIARQNWVQHPVEKLSQASRTFLGYCREVTVDLGTKKEEDYYPDIRSSSGKDETPQRAVQWPTLVTLGLPIRGVFVASTSIPIGVSKALTQSIANKDNFFRILDTASKMPVILYDDESERGWMVPMLSVILHMIHTWLSLNDHHNRVPYVEAQWRAGEAAKIRLEESWDLVLKKSSDQEAMKNMLVKDLVLEFWDGIRLRTGQDVEQRDAIPGITLQSRRLYGWDYMGIVKGTHSRRKQLKVDEDWIAFTKDVPVFVGKEFGDVIKPAPEVSICGNWNPIPSKKQCLTATIDCLRLLSWDHGGRPDTYSYPQLTNNKYWNPLDPKLFADCPNDHKSGLICASWCSKLPQSLQSKQVEGRFLEPPLHGAVVFCSKEKFPKQGKVSRGKRIVPSHSHDRPVMAESLPRNAMELDSLARPSLARPSTSAAQGQTVAVRSTTPGRAGHPKGPGPNESPSARNSQSKVSLPLRASDQAEPTRSSNPGSSRYAGRQNNPISSDSSSQRDRSPAMSMTLSVPQKAMSGSQRSPVAARYQPALAGARGSNTSKETSEDSDIVSLPRRAFNKNDGLPPLRSNEDESPLGRGGAASFRRVGNRANVDVKEEVSRGGGERPENPSNRGRRPEPVPESKTSGLQGDGKPKPKPRRTGTAQAASSNLTTWQGS